MIEMEVLKVEVAEQPVRIDPTGRTITVRDYTTTEIFALEMTDGQGTWCEIFNTERELHFFLRGMRAAWGMGGIAMPQVKFTERSIIQSL